MSKSIKNISISMLAVIAFVCICLAFSFGGQKKVSATEVTINKTTIESGDFLVSAAVRISDDTYGNGVRFTVSLSEEKFNALLNGEGEITDGVKTGALLTSNKIATEIGGLTLANAYDGDVLKTGIHDYELNEKWHFNVIGEEEEKENYYSAYITIYNVPTNGLDTVLKIAPYVTYGDDVTVRTNATAASMRTVCITAIGEDAELYDAFKEEYLKYNLNYYYDGNGDGVANELYTTGYTYYNEDEVYYLDPDNDDAVTEGVPSDLSSAKFIDWFVGDTTTVFDEDYSVTKALSVKAGYAEFAISKPLFAQYQSGGVMDPGSATLSYQGTTVAATCTVLDPSDNAVVKGESGYTLSSTGDYTVVASATVNGKNLSEEKAVVSSASAAAFISGDDADSYAYPAQVSGYGYSSMCGVHLKGGDVVVCNRYVDWTSANKTIILPQLKYMTRDEYHAAFPITINLYNADDVGEYITITITGNKWKTGDVDWDQLYYSYSYCGGATVSIGSQSKHIGSENESAGLYSFLLAITNGGESGTGIYYAAGDDYKKYCAAAKFTKAIMTIQAKADLDFTTPDFGGNSSARDWRVNDGKMYISASYQQVYFKVDGTITEHENVVTGGTANYYLAQPTKSGKYFVGWKKNDQSVLFPLSTAITGYTVLDAQFGEFSYGKPVFDQYAVGSTFDPGTANLSSTIGSASATITVKDPSGNTVAKGGSGYTLSTAGNYTVTLSATVNGYAHTETRTVECVTSVAYFSGSKAETNASVTTAYGDANCCLLHIEEGDVATLNKYVDWSTASIYTAIAPIFLNMTSEQYRAAGSIVFTFYNAEDITQYFSLRFTVSDHTSANDGWTDIVRCEYSYCGAAYALYANTRVNVGVDNKSRLAIRFNTPQYTGDANLTPNNPNYSLLYATEGTVVSCDLPPSGSGGGRRPMRDATFKKLIMTVKADTALDLSFQWIAGGKTWTNKSGTLYC